MRQWIWLVFVLIVGSGVVGGVLWVRSKTIPIVNTEMSLERKPILDSNIFQQAELLPPPKERAPGAPGLKAEVADMPEKMGIKTIVGKLVGFTGASSRQEFPGWIDVPQPPGAKSVSITYWIVVPSEVPQLKAELMKRKGKWVNLSGIVGKKYDDSDYIFVFSVAEVVK